MSCGSEKGGSALPIQGSVTHHFLLLLCAEHNSGP